MGIFHTDIYSPHFSFTSIPPSQMYLYRCKGLCFMRKKSGESIAKCLFLFLLLAILELCPLDLDQQFDRCP